jgi:hypothetical protein
VSISVETCSAPVMWEIIWNSENINFNILTQVYTWDGEQELKMIPEHLAV